MSDNNLNSKSVQKRLAALKADRIGPEDAVERLAAIRTPDRVEEIRRRRAAITPGEWRYDWGNWEVEAMPGRHPVCRTDNSDAEFPRQVCGHTDGEFIANTPADIDWLLRMLERQEKRSKTWAEAYHTEKDTADHLRKSCEMLSESVAKLTDEVGRLRAALVVFAEGEYCKVWDSLELSGDLECPGCLVNDTLCGQKSTADPLQQLTDTSQELGLYEEADNPLVKDDDEREDG